MAVLFALLFLSPLAGAILNGLVLRSRDAKKSGWIATGAAAGSFVAALLLSLNASPPITLGLEWFGNGEYNFGWEFHWDALTTVMGLMVTGIGTLIHLYSMGYMAEDPSPYRYFTYLNLFLASMLVLITGNTLLVTFVGWEGVGVCSYLLIGFWFEDPEKAKAGMKAFLLNRIGDLGFLVAIFTCYQACRAIDYPTLISMAKSGGISPGLGLVICIFLFIAATGKSAQIPLYVWLPDAMAGPTPVSALIHAATMVTAGVYLVARTSFLFELNPIAGGVVAAVGIATALLTALIALVQRDIKKILAYSTVSQLGLMFVGLGAGNAFCGIFHVFTHAFFKALLFLGAGSVIHGLHHEQDIAHMGGLKEKMPTTFWTFTVAWAAICGLPPFAGFFSKDAIVHAALEKNFVLGFLVLVVSGLTAFYMSRLYFLTFFGKYRGEAHPHESPKIMTIPLMILAAGSATVGFLGLPHAFGSNLLEHFLEDTLAVAHGHGEVSEGMAMLLSVAVAAAGIFTAYRMFFTKKVTFKKEKETPIFRLLFHKFWVDELYTNLFVSPFQRLTMALSAWFDPFIVDKGIMSPSNLATVGGKIVSALQSGLVQTYLFFLLLGALLTYWLCLRGVVI